MKLNDESKFLVGIAVVTVFFIGISYYFLNRPTAPPPPVDKSILVPSQNRLEKGNASASAYLVEFSDFQCPACATFEPTVRELVDKYSDRLHFIYRDFPLEQHEMSIPAALAARAAAAQGKYWEMHVRLFENQTRLTETYIASLAGELALDMIRFQNDQKSTETRKLVESDRADGIKAKVNATPTFFLNGRILDLKTPADLVKIIDETLNNQ
jgi:protein-disulfide isomerase